MHDQPPVSLRAVRLQRGLPVAALVMAALLASCRSVAPVTSVAPVAPVAEVTVAASATPQGPAVLPRATPLPLPVQTPVAADTPLAAPFRLDLPPGWEAAASVEGYAFTVLWRAADTSQPAAIATGLFVPADGMDLPSFLEATATELKRMDGATVLSAEVDGLLRHDGMPAGVLHYTLAHHDQLGDLPHGRQYTLAAPTADAFMAVTCLASAQAPRDPAQLCDALTNAIVFD